MTRQFSCPACEVSLNSWCAQQGAPKQLCGLCQLMDPEALERYFAKWGRIDDAPEEDAA